jgi:hypothetical protein
MEDGREEQGGSREGAGRISTRCSYNCSARTVPLTLEYTDCGMRLDEELRAHGHRRLVATGITPQLQHW